MNLDDVLFILFRHKWKILLFATLGIAAAATAYLLRQKLYESEAKLMVRYVVDRSSVDTLDAQPKNSDMGQINSEVQILTSWDLAMQVAQAVGVERLLPDAKEADIIAAASSIRAGLSAAALKNTNIIVISYKNRDPELATLVLKELVARYFTKHLEVHRSADAFDFVARQTDQVRAQLNRTEEELKELKAKAGITSLGESTTALNVELARNREALHIAETAYSGQRALVQELEKSLAAQKKIPLSTKPLDSGNEVVQQYQTLFSRLAQFRQTELEHLSTYAQKAFKPELPEQLRVARKVRSLTREPEGDNIRVPVGGSGFFGSDRADAREIARKRYSRQNDTGFAYQTGKKDFDALVKEAEQEILTQRINQSEMNRASEDQFVKVNQMQIENLERQLGDMEKRFPGLVTTIPAATAQIRELDLSADRARLKEMEARVQTITSRLRDLQKQSEQLSEFAPQITHLERRREIEDANYKYFEASLEKARVDEALDPSKIPNISAVQKPSPAVRATSDLKKTILALAGGGIAFGIALALLVELVVDRSIKRPLELTTRLRIPMLMWIPYIANRSFLTLPWRGARRESALALRASRRGEIAPWEIGHFIRPFTEALRDRITLSFQINGMTHKPKLVGVTGCSKGAGTSTLAGGLAAALSETGDGKVLLVDMNVGHATVHPFYRGASTCTLAEALVGEPASAGENLYLAMATPPDAPRAQVIPKRFHDLMPHLKASDFDYIIFDMPPLSQTSITLAVSAYMDKVLLIAEAEKSNRDVIKRAFMELSAVNASVFAVLNKLRFYTPKWLQVAY